MPFMVTGASRRPGPHDGSLAAILNADEWDQFQQWLHDFGDVNLIVKDPATADALTQTLTFYGYGAGQPNDSQQQAMFDLAQTMLIRIQP